MSDDDPNEYRENEPLAAAMWEFIEPWLEGEGFSVFKQRMKVERYGERGVICVHVRELIYRRDAGVCRLCHLTRPPFDVDHIVPWSAGGSDHTPNLQLLCIECNMIKGNRDTRMPPRPPIVTCCSFCNAEIEPGELRAWCAACSAYCSVTDSHAHRTNVLMAGHCEIGSWNDKTVWPLGRRPPLRNMRELMGVFYYEINQQLLGGRP